MRPRLRPPQSGSGAVARADLSATSRRENVVALVSVRVSVAGEMGLLNAVSVGRSASNAAKFVAVDIHVHTYTHTERSHL